MKLVINGEQAEVPEGITIAQLLERLSLPGDGVAVAVALEVVPRTQRAVRVLTEGERVEIIRAVGGG